MGIKVRLSGVWVVLVWWEGEGCGGERILERKIFFLDFLIFLDFLRFLKGSPLPRFLH